MIILEKIKKLLRLSKSTNQHEAASALARAFELARKHQVDLNNIDLSDDEAIERVSFRHGARVTFERNRVLNIVAHFFRVRIVISGENTILVGRSTDLAIAHYVHDFLLSTLRAGLRDYKLEVKRKLSRTRRENYIQGWVYGVVTKLNEAQAKLVVEDARFALVMSEVDQRVNEAFAEMFPETKTRKDPEVTRRNRSAISDGYRKGKSVNIHQPLQGPAPLALN